MINNPKWVPPQGIPQPPAYHLLIDLSHYIHKRPFPPPKELVIKEKTPSLEDRIVVDSKEEKGSGTKRREDSSSNQKKRDNSNGKSVKRSPDRTSSDMGGGGTINLSNLGESHISKMNCSNRTFDESDDLLRSIYEFKKTHHQVYD